MNKDLLKRIIIDSNVCYGRPVIGKKHRSLTDILNLLSVGRTNAQIIAVYHELEEDDIEACRLYRMIENHIPDDIEAFADAESGARPYFTDFSWFAVDKNEEIACFVTAGFGAIPKIAFQGTEKYIYLTEFINNLPHVSEYKIHSQNNDDDCIGMAQKGIYAYDWNTDYGQYAANAPYSLLVSPQKPLRLGDLDDACRDYLKTISFEQIAFNENPKIIVEEHFAKIND